MKHTLYIIFLLLLILIICVINYKTPQLFTIKTRYDCIISINIHDKFEFLLKQLENIKENVKCNYAVILNCNDIMFNECNINKDKLSENIFIHDTVLNKSRFHGSLTEGIYNNMLYALNNFTYEYFIVASSRNLFENNMSLEDLNIVAKTPHELDNRPWAIKKNEWHFPVMQHSLLVKHFVEQNKNIYNCAHEGVVYTENGCKKIIEFLESHPDIKTDLFNFNASMEEMALQTIVIHMNEYFYDIGNGCCIEQKNGPNDYNNNILKFMYKTPREMFSNKNFIICN